MSSLLKLLSPFQYCEAVTAYLLTRLNLRFTSSHLQKSLIEHPDYPSMMSIADVIGSEYNVASASFKMSWDQVLTEPEIISPLCAYIKDSKGKPGLAIINKFSPELVEFYNPEEKKTITVPTAAFKEIYLGTVMAVGAESTTGEKEYVKHHKEERRKSILVHLLALALPLITLLVCMATVITNPLSVTGLPVLFTLLTFAGCVVGALLLWHEVDQHNPALKQICQPGKKVNCSAILNSKAAKIWGLSWSSIGFGYFLGTLLTLLVSGIVNPYTLQTTGWMTALVLPYIFFSVYYQWKVAKQWCVLCLWIQGLLLLQFVTAVSGGFLTLAPFSELSVTGFLSVIAAFAFAFTATQLLLPILQKAKESRQKTVELQRQKHNPQIFDALLPKQKKIDKPAHELGITVGNLNGKIKLLKVCNPYCGPCAKAHSEMESLVEGNEEVCLQIIFTATEDDEDNRKAPVAHLLAIDNQQDKYITQKALDDWYNAPKKDYSAFSEKYKLNGELKLQDEKIKQMRLWCDATEIAFTPTFFVCMNTNEQNPQFYQLPEMYTVSDLKYFFAV